MVGVCGGVTVLVGTGGGPALLLGTVLPLGTATALLVAGFGLALSDPDSEPAPVDPRRVLEALDDGVIVLDSADRVLDCNRVAWRHAALESPEGTPVDEAFPGVERFLPGGDVADSPPDRPDDAVADVLTVTEDGETVHYDVRTAPLADGGDAGTVVHLSAVTGRIRRERELVERERELQRQNERLDEFASMVSHDLRNPLSVATACLSLAREEGTESAFDEVEAALDRMDQLTADLLAMARQGESVADRRPVSVAGVAEEAWTTTDPGDATLSTEGDAVVSADRGRLLQLFENLFRNARVHADADEVRVGTLENGFFVADDGPGIPPADRERVFDRGYSTDDDGSGYGLAIVEEVAAAHGWEVRVTDARDGGARFEVTGVETDPGATE